MTKAQRYEAGWGIKSKRLERTSGVLWKIIFRNP